MPIYGYACQDPSCGCKFDRLQRADDPPPDACPQCKKSTLARQLSAPQIRFSGNGYYETDFKAPTEQRGVVRKDGPS